jgi:hypothetical protein
MTPSEIESLFTRPDGSYAFARWGRPIVPIVFGVDDKTLETVKGAIEAVVALAGHKMAETDPELGANLMFFFFREWDELLELPDLGKMIPNLDTLVGKLKAADASQYRAFRFDDQGAIQAGFVFLKMRSDLSKLPAETLALGQVVQTMLIWADTAFATQSPLAVAGEATILRPDIAGGIRAAYDPVMPVAANDPSHALRLFARMQAG